MKYESCQIKYLRITKYMKIIGDETCLNLLISILLVKLIDIYYFMLKY